MRLKPNSSLTKLKKYVKFGKRETLLVSDKRKRYLEALAQLHVPEVTLKIEASDRAYCSLTKGKPLIAVHGIPLDQPATDLDETVWDLLSQKTRMYHEVGHHLYTDGPKLEEEKQVRPRAFHSVWNVIEDAAIERILTNILNIEDDLKVKNANLLHIKNVEGREVGFLESVMLFLMEYKYDSGKLAALMDPTDDRIRFENEEDRDTLLSISDELNAAVVKAVNENDPIARIEQICDIWDDIIEPHVESGDMCDGIVLMMSASVIMTGAGEEPETDEEAEVKHVMIQMNSQGYTPEEVDGEEVEASYQSETNNAVEVEREQEIDKELENYQEIVRESNLSSGLRIGKVDPNRGDARLRQDAKAKSKGLVRRLENRLREQRRTSHSGGHRSGRIDHNRVHLSKRGETRLFRQADESAEKDYRCVIILDRSGSMKRANRSMSEVVTGTAALAYALEEVGVDVSIMSFYDDKPKLEKMFGNKTDTSADLFDTRATGGTPLADTLKLVREHLKNGKGHPFVVAITDGGADNADEYFNELEKCRFPVVGVTVGVGNLIGEEFAKHQSQYYHAHSWVSDEETVKGLERMIERIMF